MRIFEECTNTFASSSGRKSCFSTTEDITHIHLSRSPVETKDASIPILGID
jgi:hypothetical protein